MVGLISAAKRSDRGFCVVVDRKAKKVLISFNANKIDPRHKEWLQSVAARAGLRELDPQPYWGFDDLKNKVAAKLHNCFYVQAEVKREDGVEYFKYTSIQIMTGCSLEGLLLALESGNAYVDFDARSGHNHGTKFRLRQNHWPDLYASIVKL